MADEFSIFYLDAGTPYVRIRRDSDDFVWDGSALVAWSDAGVADYKVSLTNRGGGWWRGSIPADLPVDDYSVQYAEQTGGTPTITDSLLDAQSIHWNGTAASEPAPGYEGRYTTEGKVEQYLGTLNLDVYADVNSDGARDAGATQQAIVSGEARVDYYREGPFDIGDGSSVGAQLLETWSRKLAAVEVARKRLGKTTEDLDDLEDRTIIEMKMGNELPGITPDPTDTSALERLLALNPVGGKLNCCRPCDTTNWCS